MSNGNYLDQKREDSPAPLKKDRPGCCTAGAEIWLLNQPDLEIMATGATWPSEASFISSPPFSLLRQSKSKLGRGHWLNSAPRPDKYSAFVYSDSGED
jgi:hypothetical protein